MPLLFMRKNICVLGVYILRHKYFSTEKAKHRVGKSIVWIESLIYLNLYDKIWMAD